MNIHAVTPAQATRLPLRMSDLVESEGDEPRIPDLTLADRLGFSKPHNVRKLILRNRDELRMHGEIVTRGNILRRGEKGRGRPGTMYLLNEGQSLVVCALSRTPIAAMIRQDVIAVYMAHRRGEGPTTRQERHALRYLCQFGHVVPAEEPIYLNGSGFRASGTVLIAPVTETVLSALASFEAHMEDDELEEDNDDVDGEDNGDAEHILGWSESQSEGQQSWLTSSDDRERDLDLEEADAPFGSVDDEPTLGWTNIVRQTDLGQGHRSDGEEENTAPERHGGGFVRCGEDDEEPSLGAVNPIPGIVGFTIPGVGYVQGGDGIDQTHWGRTGTSDREVDAGDQGEDGCEDDGMGDFAGGDRLGADERSECWEGFHKPYGIGRG